MATSSQDSRLQPIFDMAVEAWEIAHSTCEFGNVLMRSNGRRKDKIRADIVCEMSKIQNDSSTVNGHLHFLMCLSVVDASVT